MSRGSVFNETEWEKLKLAQLLSSTPEGKDDWVQIKRTGAHIADLLVWRPPGLEDFTDHDIRHCYRMAANLGAVIPENAQLNTHELRILLLAILYHDVGMWTRSRDVMKSLADEQFTTFCQQNCKERYSAATGLVHNQDAIQRSLGRLLLRGLVAQWNRSRHPEKGATSVRQAVDHATIVPAVISEEDADCVALLVEAHGWDCKRILEDECLDRRRIGSSGIDETDFVNLRYLAHLLRLADLLDLDEGRVSSLVWDYLKEPFSEAEKHWRKHKGLKFQSLEPDLIRVKGVFDYDKDGPVAAEAYELAKHWLDYLRDEIEGLRRLCLEHDKRGQDSRVAIGGLNLDTVQVVPKGIVFTEELAFALDKGRIIEILGKEIYADGCVFIRELLQNALDATRTQMVRDYTGENGPERKQKFGNAKLDLRRPSFWPAKYTSAEDYRIEVSVGTITENGKDYTTFEIADKGIGMTVDQIKGHFLQVGRSWYRTNQFRDNYRHSAISRFGIGFLSSLLVADRIEVVTRPLGAAEGIRLTINCRSHFCSAFRHKDAAAGTRVKLWIDREAVHLYDGWDEPPLVKDRHPWHGKISKVLGQLPDSTVDGFETAVPQWCVWPEFTLTVNGRACGPRSPHKASAPGFFSWPFELSSGHDVVAHGYISCPTSQGFPNPQIRPWWGTDDGGLCPSWGGIAIAPWDASDFLIVVDAATIPDDVLAASRRSRGEFLPGDVKSVTVQRWFDYVDGQLKDNDPWRAIWRVVASFTDIGQPWIMPVRRGREIAWERWDNSRLEREPCLLVPFFAPFHLTTTHRLPIVGVPQHDHLLQHIKQLQRIPSSRCAVPLEGRLTACCLHPRAVAPRELLTQGYTFMLDGLHYWHPNSGQWVKVDDGDANRPDIQSQLPAYDAKGGGPDSKQFAWEHDMFDDSPFDSPLLQRFGPIPRIKRPRRPVRIDVSHLDWPYRPGTG